MASTPTEVIEGMALLSKLAKIRHSIELLGDSPRGCMIMETVARDGMSEAVQFQPGDAHQEMAWKMVSECMKNAHEEVLGRLKELGIDPDAK